MTVCIGAISKNGDASKEYAVVVSDRMVTLSLPSIEFEQKLSKSVQITQNCVVSTAGSSLAFADILKDVSTSLSADQSYEMHEIIEKLKKSYNKIRSKKIEENILNKIGISTLHEFFDRNQILSKEMVDQIFEAIATYDYGLVLLVTGVDNSGAHVYRINNPGASMVYDNIGYCAIGIGDIHAISTFITNDYDPYLDLDHIVALS
ncbi:MAG: hypothetical protein L0H53_06140 [Candidatus Nitrosocosmicus sp.]|nr:hypothetical protein [Candidatus Nitrosocosmicus sp.]MDN5867374.1 hypothetical protein [Candidatus Nitrosocosmicus sp.]